MTQTPFFSARARRAMPSRGFTLIELMIVVAIVAILAAIAYPSYMDSVRKGWRTEARAALMAEMQQQERFFTQMNKYTTTVSKAFSGEDAGSSKYGISAEACTGTTIANCVKLTAALNSGLSDPKVGNITLDSTGTKGCTGTDPTRCWK